MEVVETDGGGEDNNNILDDKRNKDNAEADNEIFDVAIIVEASQVYLLHYC